jgi:hypothetical protein
MNWFTMKNMDKLRNKKMILYNDLLLKIQEFLTKQQYILYHFPNLFLQYSELL